MKMGIERVLRENFANLGEVVAVSPPQKTQSVLTAKAVADALAPVLPALKALGGTVEVVSVDGERGAVLLKFKGPEKLRQGIELVLRDVKTVLTVDIESF